MRWEGSREEVYGFGVNYSVPFAHAFRTARRLKVPIIEAMEEDVYHFARLGFDAYRLHVWDTEISDTLGNLLENEHLRLFDYLLFKMKERGMKILLTPIAFWGNGWPERDEPTPGFSAKYGKGDCLTNPSAIKAQENYLFQFLKHVNTYTGIAYKDDPDIIAFEVSNEPHHREEPEKVTEFIQRMVAAMRKTGSQKPIFYNISHSVHLGDAYFDAGIQGGTFQWYPTGLGAGHELGGNLLPNVEDYRITPYLDNPKFERMAKVVYEFDAADVGRSYIYPAMARSFREAGIQWATHFAYDPTYMAFANTEYNTHFMNLAYTPQKALSLKISSEVFHRIPIYRETGPYPQNTRFGPFRISYEDDLAEMITRREYFYTNHTESWPESLMHLEEIAGWGNSPVVQYDGTGAYFLDRLDEGVWRLEVMPDAIWIDNPFGRRNSLKRKVAVVNWRTWAMHIQLPDLGAEFQVVPLNVGNHFQVNAFGHSFQIRPGTYLLVRKGVKTSLTGTDRWKNIRLGEFAAPAGNLEQTYVLHEPLNETTAQQSYKVEATIASPEPPETVELFFQGPGYWLQRMEMTRGHGYAYSATIPDSLVREGFINYFIVVKAGEEYITYPGAVKSYPLAWDFYGDDPYEVRVSAPEYPVYLFDAKQDADRLQRRWLRNSRLTALPEPGKAELELNVERLFVPDPENRKEEPVYDYSMRFYFGEKVSGRIPNLLTKDRLVFKGRALNNKHCKLQLALVMKDGTAYGGTIDVQPEGGNYGLALQDLQKVKLVTLPRPYPTFLPYYFDPSPGDRLDLSAIETLQISIGPGIPEAEREVSHGVAIESVWLE